MNRGLILSAVLHAVGFALVLLGPATRARPFDLSDAIPITLAPPPQELPEPKAAVPEPEPEPVKPPVIEPMPESPPEPIEPEVVPEKPAPEPPAPVVKAPPKKVRPPRKFQRVAPRREESEPTLEERLRERLQSERPVDAAPETAPAAEPARPSNEPAPTERATARVEASDFPFAWYLNTIRTRVTDSWDPPADTMIAEGGHDVMVAFRIHRDGRVTDIRIESRSQTPGLETSARRAVDVASRDLPPLPEPYTADFLDVRIRFTVTRGTG